MKVYIKGKGQSVFLNNSDFLAARGEGKVYIKNKIAYKIYNNRKKMIPASKISELSVLDRSNIIRPKDILLNNKNQSIGYTMKYMRGTQSLCKMFTKSFKNRNNITNDMTINLVKLFREGVEYIHKSKILIVDLNEMNFLLNKKFNDIFFIDVDSYQTFSFPATAIMESIRDRHSTTHSEETDWFSWGIITFQMFIGIHPYKGKHSSYKDLDSRMFQNISVFNKGVSIPKICSSFNVIPQLYLDWYKAVFEDGKRIAPPEDLQAVIVIAPTVSKIVGSNNFDVNLVKRYDSDIISCAYLDGKSIVTTADSIVVGDKKYSDLIPDSVIGITPKIGYIINACLDNEKVKLKNLTKNEDLSVEIPGDSIMSYNGRIYIKRDLALLELQFIEIGTSLHVASKQVANVTRQSTHLYDGVVLQDLLGSWYVSVFPEAGTCRQSQIKELDDYRVIDAKYDNKVLMIVAEKKGKYNLFILRFNSDYSSYDIRIKKDISYSGLNFVTLDNGICISLNENEELELFANIKNHKDIKIIDDPAIKGSILYKNGTQTLIAKNKELLSIKTK